MSDDGYTLAEMLAALTMVALAVIGLGGIVRTVGSAQFRIENRHRAHVAWSSLELETGAMLATAGPFLPHDPASRPLSGDRREVSFGCGESTCGLKTEQGGEGARVRVFGGRREHTFILRDARAIELRYISSDGESRTEWPSTDGAGRLIAISIIDRDVPRVVMPIGIEQSSLCVFQASDCDAAHDGSAND